MRNAAGLLELLFVLLIIIVVYFSFFSGNKYGRSNPFDDNVKIKNQQQLVDDKLKEIEQAKQIRQNIEKNLEVGY